MSKGEYNVQKGHEGPPPQDNSFRSCLCSLLIVLAICIILIMGGIKWTKRSIDEDHSKQSEILQQIRKTPSTPQMIQNNIVKTTTKIFEKPTFLPTFTNSWWTRISKSTQKIDNTELIDELERVTEEINVRELSTEDPDYKEENFDKTTTVSIGYETENGTDDNFLETSSTIEETEEQTEFAANTEDLTTTEIIENVTTVITNQYNEKFFTDLIPTEKTDLNNQSSTKNQVKVTTISIPTTATTEETILVKEQPSISSTTQKFTTVKLQTTEKFSIGNEKIETTQMPFFAKQDPVCLSPACKFTASKILTLMNHSVDPCENFYEFACGGLEIDNSDAEIFAKISQQLYWVNDTSANYLNKFKSFYESCVTHEFQFVYEERIQGVLDLVKEVGTILDGNPMEDIDMTEIFSKLILRQSLSIMDVDVDIDKQTANFILKLTLARKSSALGEGGRWSAETDAQKRCLEELRGRLQGRTVNLTEIHGDYVECQKNHSLYLNSIQTVVKALGFYSHLNDTFNRTQRIQDLRTTIEWDILDHMNILPSPSAIKKTILFKEYTLQKISDLQVQYPYLQWNRLFSIITGHTVANNTLIQVYFPQYFTKLFNELAKISKWKINNALIAMYAHDLYQNLVIPVARHQREDYCTRLASKLFHDIASNLYMKTWSKEDVNFSQKLLRRVFDHLKENFTQTLQKVSWLDDASRISILLKTKKLNLVTSTNEDLYNNDTYLNLKYGDIDLNYTDFSRNALKMIVVNRKMLYGLEGKAYTINYLWSYFLNPYDKSPSSFYSKHLIVAPVEMVKSLAKGLPGYVTMARIGVSLAREIGRHFDPVGINYGMTLSATSKPSYESYKMNLNNAISYTTTRFLKGQRVTFLIDGQLSLNERIVDSTGLRMAYDGFNTFGEEPLLPWVSNSFSREKLFFITTAQEYCKKTDINRYMLELFESDVLPATLRVENILTNSEAFVQAFECPEGSAMNNNQLKAQFPYLAKNEESYNYNYDNTDEINP